MPFRAARSTPLLAALLAVAFAASCGSGNGGMTNPPEVDGNPYDGSGIIGPAGGIVSLAEGASIDIPAGALSQDTRITITAVATPADLQAADAIGQAYRIAPVDLTLTSAARVSIFIPDADIGGRAIASLTILRSTQAGADLAPAGGLTPADEELGGVQQTGGATVSGTTNRLGTFSVAATEPPNRNPTANAGPDQSANTGHAVGLAGSGSDPDGDPVTFAWTFQSRPGGSSATINNANAANATFTPDVAGTYVVLLTVSDGKGGTATDTATVTVTDPPANQVVADAGPDQNGSVGTAVQLDGRGSTGMNLTYAWRIVSAPGGTPAISNATSAQASFTPSAAGDYLVELTVTDGATADRDTVRISVIQPNRAPTVSLSGPTAVLVGSQATVQATTSDPDGDPVNVVFALQKPAGSAATLTVNGNQASFTPDVPGAYRVEATAGDGTTETNTSATVFGNADVAGTYSTTFRITGVSGNCLNLIQVGDETTADMVVTQPSPSNVVLRLSDFANLSRNASGMLQGLQYSFNGTLTFTDGTQSVDAQGSINGSFSTNPMGLDLSANFSAAGGICQATAKMISP